MSPSLLTMRSPFSIDVRPERDRVRVEPVGELDLLTARQVDDRVAELTSAGFTRVLVDLRRVEFIDSSGLRLLLRLRNRAHNDGWDLGIVQGRESVRKLFELTGTLGVLPFEDDGPRPLR
jgi:anti-sigma B factor antagonist